MCTMILDMISLTFVHVALSLIGIFSGFVVVFGLFTEKRLDSWTAVFLITTAATSVTGFFFPFNGFTAADAFGIISLIVLPIAIFARYGRQLAGGWRRTYVVTAMIALYLNVFVLIAQLYYKDWGKGQPIVFSHGWPLSADDWDTQMLFFLNHGYRVIAHDRRGHGRSSQTGDGHDMDHYADDLAALTAHLDLKEAVHVGHSTGGGEVVHYLARHGESRVTKAVIISAVPPLMVKTAANPGGLSKEVRSEERRVGKECRSR